MGNKTSNLNVNEEQNVGFCGSKSMNTLYIVVLFRDFQGEVSSSIAHMVLSSDET